MKGIVAMFCPEKHLHQIIWIISQRKITMTEINTGKLLEAGKYSRKGYPLPTLQVVDQGALKGFVPVNRAWNGFSTDDYKKASLSAYDEDTKHEDTNEFHAEQTNKSAFDLSGYEIVRAQFFSTRFDPAVTISSGKITFNTACMKKFENVRFSQFSK